MTKRFKINGEQIKFYEDNGYLIVSGFFEQDYLKIRELCRDLADPTFKIKMNPDREVPEIKSIIQDGRLADVLEPLHQNMPLDWLMCQIHFRQPGSFFTRGWNEHQDNHYTQHPYGMGATAIIALEDADIENGCLFLYSGSHKLPILYHEPHPTFNSNENPGNKCEVPSEFLNKKINVFVKGGDLYVQHGNLIHGSYPNNSKTRSRLQLGISCLVQGQAYNAKGENSKRMPQPLRG